MTEIQIYADEDVNLAIVEGLKRRGIHAYSCLDFGNKGLSDTQQLEFALKKHFVILTHDTDFLRLVHTEGLLHSGIIFVSQTKMSVGEVIRSIEYLVSIFQLEDMENHIEFL